MENNGGVNYGRIAKAMGNMMQHGIKIALPDLNRAHFGFYPDVADGEIVYGLKPIQGWEAKLQKLLLTMLHILLQDNFMKRCNNLKKKLRKISLVTQQ